MNAPVPTLDIWPEQVIRGHSIPGSRYTCRDFMEKEWESKKDDLGSIIVSALCWTLIQILKILLLEIVHMDRQKNVFHVKL